METRESLAKLLVSLAADLEDGVDLDQIITDLEYAVEEISFLANDEEDEEEEEEEEE